MVGRGAGAWGRASRRAAARALAAYASRRQWVRAQLTLAIADNWVSDKRGCVRIRYQVRLIERKLCRFLYAFVLEREAIFKDDE